jgi:DNA modification methylase
LSEQLTIAHKRNYRVLNVEQAKDIAFEWLKAIDLNNVIKFGLPEVDDRYHIWRVPLRNSESDLIGEVVINAHTSFVNESKTTDRGVLEARLLGRNGKTTKNKEKNSSNPKLSTLRNTIGLGDSEQLLIDTPSESIDLIFTSPPYYNARPEYADYLTYEEYLLKMKKIIHQSHRVLNEGRFFVINIAPVLIRRASRSEASKRIAVPFDFHRLFIEEDFEFVEDIIWQKPEGAGWATGRGRRFSADRNPLQYKSVPVTEYILVYRKKTDKLIDWHIRKHPDQELVAKSKIEDGYEVTNIWKIHPSYTKKHPAVFPTELAEKVIKYYSFINDVVLDPFAGIGTVGKAASTLDRRFVLYEKEPKYINEIKSEVNNWIKGKDSEPLYINCEPVNYKNLSLFD